MSQLYVDNIRNRTGGPIGIPTGAVVTGVLTATTGNITGNMTVGGVLTYEDVTNVDSVGIITAQSGIRVGAGESIGSNSGTVYYYGNGENLTGVASTDNIITSTASTFANINSTGIVTANSFEGNFILDSYLFN